MLSNGTNVISVGHVVIERRSNLCADSLISEMYVAKKIKKLDSPVRLPLMPPNSSRAYFNRLNETNGAYKDNFFELFVKIVNYSDLKGPGRQFSQTTLYTHMDA